MWQRLTIREWIKKFNNEEFSDNSFSTQTFAGWYDWFCKDTSLRNKTYKMGKIIKQVKDGGKVDLDNTHVWFKNNCPLCGPLYDDFRFADYKTGDTQFTITIDSPWEKAKYCVYARRKGFEKPAFETKSSRELVKWLNTPWEVENEK